MACILVVEDNAAFCENCRCHMETLGHRVIAMETAEDAIEFIDDGNIDLAVVDLILPGMDGAEFVRWMRARPETQNLPVIAFTRMGNSVGLSLDESDKIWLPADLLIDKTDGTRAIALAVESLLEARLDPPAAAPPAP